jgi:hypothetical protein
VKPARRPGLPRPPRLPGLLTAVLATTVLTAWTVPGATAMTAVRA